MRRDDVGSTEIRFLTALKIHMSNKWLRKMYLSA